MTKSIKILFVIWIPLESQNQIRKMLMRRVLNFANEWIYTCWWYTWKEIFHIDHQHSLFASEYFRVTILCPQKVVAECWLTDDPLLLDTGGVLTLLSVASKESKIFDSSQPPSLFRVDLGSFFINIASFNFSCNEFLLSLHNTLTFPEYNSCPVILQCSARAD